MTRVLVIRLGALGDFVLSFGPFAAIRAHHPEARITLLTTPPFAVLGLRSPWFDSVSIDRRPKPWDIRGLLALRRSLRGYDMIYDLQTSTRSSRYFVLAGRPDWSGIAPGCRYPHANPDRDGMHTIERQREQLRMAGIADIPRPSVAWLGREPPAGLPSRYAMLVPGASPGRPAKRWPAERFAALARYLDAEGLPPVVIGTSAESEAAAAIQRACPTAIDLTGRTSLMDVAAIASGAAVAIGNDTGPMHLAAAMGCRSVVLFSSDSDPALTAPRMPDGGWPTVLRVPDLADLPAERVAAALG